MEKAKVDEMINDLETRTTEMSMITGLASHAAESIALQLSNKEIPDYRLAFHVVSSIDMISEKLDALVISMYEHRKMAAEAA